jgi:hypothetical protein
VQAELDNLSLSVRQKLARFARRWAKELAKAGVPIAGNEHDHIVHDAIADTLHGVVARDRRIEIGLHLMNVVKRRSSNRIRRARKQVHVSLDAISGGGDLPAAASLYVDHERSMGRAQVTAQLWCTIRELVAGDTAVLLILDAYKAEVSQPRDVMKLTGLGLPDFSNARRRLDRVLCALPLELRRDALEAMRDSHVREILNERNG